MKKANMLLSGTLAILLVACGGNPNMKFGDDEYPVETISSTGSSTESSYPAVIRGIQDVEIRPKVSGFITQLNVKEGQSVSAGQVLFVIDNSTYQAAVRQSQAAVTSAQSQLSTAKLAFDNSSDLFKKNIIGNFEMQSAQNTYETAKAGVVQAQAALASAKEMLSFCYVKSPAAGIVGNLPYKVGALVSSSSPQPLTTVSNINTVEVYFSVTEKDMIEMTKSTGNIDAAIADMPAVKLKLADGTVYNHSGKVVKMSGVIDQATGSSSLIARFPNPDKLLKSGGSGSILVPHISNNAIVIPQSWAFEIQNKVFVYTVDKDNKAKHTEIKVDPKNDGQTYVVTSGLNIGDRVVTNGITKLNDGMAIKPITKAQYNKKIEEAAKLGGIQGNFKKMKEAFK